MVNILINNTLLASTNESSYTSILETIQQQTKLRPNEYYLLHNGKRLSCENTIAVQTECDVHCVLRSCGGKGGFGSMLRAIGAQIEKTTNREACRDLSGRRLRDINEEKRLRAWLDKQSEREREAEERKKRKIEKLLAVPKHEFKDEEYEKARSNLTETVYDAFEEGFKKELEAQNSGDTAEASCSRSVNLKRKKSDEEKCDEPKTKKMSASKVKGGLWLGDGLSDTDSSSSDEESNHKEVNSKSVAII